MHYHADFNVFFKLNQKEIQKYVDIVSWKYAHIMDPDDIAQEIILKLMKSSFLTDWEEERAALQTFFTQRIRGYALHAITKEIRRVFSISKETDNEGTVTESFTPLYEQLDKERDFSNYNAESKGYFHEIASDEPSQEEDLFYNEIMKLFQGKISEFEMRIYELHRYGHTFDEIKAILSETHGETYSYSYIRNRCHKVIEIMLKILSNEGVKSALIEA